MKKLIISQSQDLPGNISALTLAPGLLQNVLFVLLTFEQEVGLAIVDHSKTYNALDFVNAIAEVIPNADKDRQLHFRADVLTDSKILERWTKAQIIEREGSKLAGIQISETAMLEMIQIDHELLIDVIESQRALDTFRHELPKEQVFWDYISVGKSQVTVKENAANDLTERLTTYASAGQIKFASQANDLLSKLSELERSYNAPGLILKASAITGSVYTFNESFLTNIRQ